MRTKFFMRAFLVVVTIVLYAGVVAAADINGKWTAPATSPSGSPMGDRVFTFKADGNKLTGTVITQQTVNATFEVEGKPKMVGKLTTQSGSPAEISDGKISGDEISFVTVMKMGPMEMKTVYSGKISGDEINVTAETVFPEGFSPPSMPGGPSQGEGEGPKPQEMVLKRMAP